MVLYRRFLLTVRWILVVCLIVLGGYEISAHLTSAPPNADTYRACKQFELVFKNPVPEASIKSVSRKIVALGLKSNDSEVVDAAQLLSGSNAVDGMLGFVDACRKIGIRH
jgi:hypothetical protein